MRLRVGNFSYPITLIGPLGEVTLDALVDTRALYTWIPRPLLERLGIQVMGQEPFVFADGRVVYYDVGELTARIDGKQRTATCVFGEPNTMPLLGAFTLEAFLLGVDPVNNALIPVIARL